MTLQPNVVLILMDATRADHLGCYGYTRETSLNIDQFAREAVLYENAYSPAAWTLPAISSIFTGLYPAEHGVHFGNRYLDTRFRTLAELLMRRDYQTLGVTSNAWLAPLLGLARGFQEFRLVDRVFQEMPPKRWQAAIERMACLIRRSRDKGGQRITDLAIEWLSQRHKNQPFFLFLHYLEPHGPYRPAWQWAEPFFGDRAAYDKALKVSDVELAYLAHKVKLGDSEMDQIGRLYDAQLRYVDLQVGKILTRLEEMKLLQDTLVIITADHGENLGDHGLLGHQYCLYESLLHVPLIIRFPRRPIHSHDDHLVLNMDIFATVLSQLGFRQTDFPYARRWVNLDSRSLVEDGVPEYAFAQYLRPMIERFARHYPEVDYSAYNHELWAVRSDQYKLIRRDDGHLEFYDVKRDPEEKFNLREDCPGIVSEMIKVLDKSRMIDQTLSSDQPMLELDRITEERLRALGYIE